MKSTAYLLLKVILNGIISAINTFRKTITFYISSSPFDYQKHIIYKTHRGCVCGVGVGEGGGAQVL